LGKLDEKGARFGLQGARAESASAELAKFEAHTLFFVEWILLNVWRQATWRLNW
jgi:hypothetical protein